MKKSSELWGLILAAAAFHGVAAAADVGVSVNISQPGFYGRIDIGRVPAPMVIYPQPVIIEQHPVTVLRQPIYLRVPPGHEKNWNKHCRGYDACGQPVYFVQDHWCREVYAPGYFTGRERSEGLRENHHRGHNKIKKGHSGD